MKKNLLLALFALISMCSFATSNEKPNVIFIICDDLNDYGGAFGGHPQAKTPNIDKLAQSGVRFMNAQSNCPLCQPSRNSLMTGVYPSDSKDFVHKVDYYDQPVLKNCKTIVQLLNENGYNTLGSGKVFHGEQENNREWKEWGVTVNHYGPFVYNGADNVGHPDVPEPFRSIGSIDGSFSPIEVFPEFSEEEKGEDEPGWVYDWDKTDIRYFNCIDADNRDLLPDEMHAKWAAEKIKEMDESGNSEPFFMGVGFARPHTPLHAPQRFFDMFPIDELEVPERLEGDNLDTYFKELYPTSLGLRLFRLLDEAYNYDTELAVKTFLQAYLACVAFADEQVGKVIDALDNSRFKDNTVVIFTADHGWHVGEKDFLHKNSPWEESIRVPFVIRDPREQKGTQVSHPISLIDIYPTIVDLCALKGDTKKNENGVDIGGYSLVPFLKNPDTEDWDGPDGALTLLALGALTTGNKKIDQTYSYRTEDWRYIHYPNGKEELYNHKEDPYEWHNLADNAKYASSKNKLKKQVEEMVGIVFPEEIILVGWEDFKQEGKNGIPSTKSCTGIDVLVEQSEGWKATADASVDGTFGTFAGADTETGNSSVLKAMGEAQTLTFTLTNNSSNVVNARHFRFDIIAQEGRKSNTYSLQMQNVGENRFNKIRYQNGVPISSLYSSTKAKPESGVDVYQNVDVYLKDVILKPKDSIKLQLKFWQKNVFIDNVALTGTIPDGNECKKNKE